MPQYKILTGNYAVAYGVKLSKPQVIAAYPITPQTTIVEKLSEFIERGELKARMLRVESEHSAMAAVIGAALTGARTFTATSSQGLLYMHEGVWMASGARLPIVMAIVTRAIFPPWNIWTDHGDLLDQRDTGWIICMVEDIQEALDMVIQAYKIAEDERVLLPVMVGLDSFILSHTATPVEIPDEDVVDSYLPAPGENTHYPKISFENPLTYFNLVSPDSYMEFRYQIQEAINRAKRVIIEADEKYHKLVGRRYGGLIETYRCTDANIVIVAMGALIGDAKEAVDKLRDEGYSVGVLKLRFIRPFPEEELRKVLLHKKLVIVIDRAISFGKGGILYTEVSSALYEGRFREVPVIRGYVTGLGGRDITVNDVITMVKRLTTHLERGTLTHGWEWFKLRREVIE